MVLFFIFSCFAYCKYKKWVYICTMQNEINNTQLAHFQINDTIYVVQCNDVCNALDQLQSQGVDLTSARLLKVTTGV